MNSLTHLRSNTSTKNIRRYDEIRGQIKNGDVLMYRGNSLESRLIMYATRSRYSHAGIAIWWNDRLMVMEAIGKGVVVRPLSLSVQRYYGDVELFTSVDEISEEDRHRIVKFAQEELGKEYATWKALKLGLRILFSRHKEARDRLRRERQLFCSYYVAQTYNSIGRDLKEGVSDRFMTPGDVAASPMLKWIRKRGRPPSCVSPACRMQVRRSIPGLSRDRCRAAACRGSPGQWLREWQTSADSCFVNEDYVDKNCGQKTMGLL